MARRCSSAVGVVGVGSLTLTVSLVSGSTAAAAGRPSVLVNSLADPATPTSVIGRTETLADAIEHLDTIAGGGRIMFASRVSGTITLAHALPEITQPITIDGPGAGRLTIDGGGSHGLRYPVLTVSTLSGGTTAINGLTLTDGDAPTYGGAVRASTPVDIVDSTLRGNRADKKGGAIFTESSLEIVDSTVSGNRSGGWDGGLAARPGAGARVIVEGSTFSGNRALGAGDGAMYLGSPALIEKSTIAHNSSRQYGAGIGFHAGTAVTIVDSTITANSVTGHPHSSGQTALYSGGGIAQSAGVSGAHTDLGIYDSIVSGNADRSGTGADVYLVHGVRYGAPTALFSLIGQTIGSGIVQDSGHTDLLGTHAHPISARLGALGHHGGLTETMVPKLGSPVFAAGDAALFAPGALPFGTTRDQRGTRRRPGVAPGGGDGTDIGAVEIPKRTRAVSAGNRELVLTTLAPRFRASRRMRLPVLYTVVKLRHPRRPRLRFRRLVLKLSGARRAHVYRSDHGRVSLPLGRLRRGRHRLTAIATLAGGHGSHTRTGDVRLRFTVRVR